MDEDDIDAARRWSQIQADARQMKAKYAALTLQQRWRFPRWLARLCHRLMSHADRVATEKRDILEGKRNAD